MAAECAVTAGNFHGGAKNSVKLRKHASPPKLFPTTRTLEDVAIDILGPLPESKREYRFLLIISDRFTKLTQVTTLRRITAYNVTVAFCESWVFKYGPPRTLQSDNDTQFASKLFRSV